MTADAGRFAPSPTGPLHLGSLLAATASYLDARQRGSDWLLRIDDLDAPRNVPGAEASILASLEAHGLHWNGPVMRQSERLPLYVDAIDRLTREGQTYYCTCSRRQLKGLTRYPGTCREKSLPAEKAALRVRTTSTPIAFEDLVAGPIREVLAETVGDFVIRRRDGIIAYQLATAVDDGQPEIGRVIRGRDLLDNTARQIYLIRLLGGEAPEYGHVPILVNEEGQKLSKQTLAAPLDDRSAASNLVRVLPALGVPLPADTAGSAPELLLDWAAERFSVENLRDAPSSYRH
jgi:glutamyl-Q tRNA(Asp) synthetase